ncbi:MAG: Crp/Fnr family transcriptional regulator [Cyclobacteriaceae bacterium]|nr:Crp/Fnr family transcriptional regulator [Cyclobacteriaceae bacterium]
MHPNSSISDYLEQHFSNFEQALKDEIINEGDLVEFPADELLMDIGQEVEVIPLIVSGSVKVFREDEEDNEVFLYYLEPSEACAITLICSEVGGTSKIKAIPAEDTKAIVMPIEKMDIWMKKYNSWYLFVMTSYQYRFDELLKFVDSVTFRRMDDRLLDYLRKTAIANNSPIIKETQQSIAQELHSSREVVGRLLKKLEQKKVIAFSRNQIELLDFQP